MNAKPQTELNISVFMQKWSSVAGALDTLEHDGDGDIAKCDRLYIQRAVKDRTFFDSPGIKKEIATFENATS